MISYKFTWEHEAARETVGANTERGPRRTAESERGIPRRARAAGALTKRRVVDFCRVAAAL
jgi:uncharacterized MAPEG superfamily protein